MLVKRELQKIDINPLSKSEQENLASLFSARNEKSAKKSIIQVDKDIIDYSAIAHMTFDANQNLLLLKSQISYGRPNVCKRTTDFLVVGTDLNYLLFVLLKSATTAKQESIALKVGAEVHSLEVCPDKKLVLVGVATGEVLVYSLENRKNLVKYHFHQAPVNNMLLVGQDYISSDTTGTIYISSLESNRFDKWFTGTGKVPLFSKPEEQLAETCHSIKMMPPHISEKYFQKLALISLCYKDLIKVMLRNKTGFNTVFEMQKPMYIQHPEKVVPIVSFGDGHVKSSESSISFLLAAWGDYVYLVRICLFESHMAFHQMAYLRLSSSVISANFIDASIILVALEGESASMSLLHTTEFEFGFPEHTKEVPIHPLLQTYAYKNEEVELHNTQVNCQLDRLVAINRFEFFVINQKVIVRGRIKQWAEFLNE